MKYQKGMRQWGKQPGRKANERWDRNLHKLEEPSLNEPVMIRPVGGILAVGVHYVVFYSPKDGQRKGFFTLCPNFNLEEQAEQDGNCPLCRDFHRYLEVKDDKYKYLRMGIKYRYLFHAFHVTNIQEGLRTASKRFGLIETHELGIQDIEEQMMIKKGAKPDDPDNGYCLTWLRTESKKGSQYGGVKVGFTAADSTKVKWNDEAELWKIRVDGKLYSGKEQDLLAKIPEPPTAAELAKKLSDLGLYEALAKGTGGSGRAATTDEDEASPDRDEWDEAEDASDDAGEEWEEGEEEGDEEDSEEDVEEEEGDEEDSEEDAEEEWDEEEEDEGDEDEEEEWDEEEDSEEDSEEDEDAEEEWDEEEEDEGDEDEEEEPPVKPKKAVKKATKASKKKAPAKKTKANKKAAKDDEWGDWD